MKSKASWMFLAAVAVISITMYGRTASAAEIGDACAKQMTCNVAITTSTIYSAGSVIPGFTDPISLQKDLCSEHKEQCIDDNETVASCIAYITGESSSGIGDCKVWLETLKANCDRFLAKSNISMKNPAACINYSQVRYIVNGGL